ncbi:MAG: hypothetical protein KDB27_06585 [Planctomycetales bacterium]|nr:hypothetical protein [Planctomycetales bacterium]
MERKRFFIQLFILCCVLASFGRLAVAQVPAPQPAANAEKLSVYYLKHVPAKDATSVLQRVFDGEPNLKIAADDRINAIIIRANDQTSIAIATILERMDIDSPGESPDGNMQKDVAKPVTNYRIHVDWLMTAEEEGQAVPEKLKGVATALEKHGISDLRLIAATVASVQSDVRRNFTLRCSPVEGDVTLDITGELTVNEGGTPSVNLAIEAEEQNYPQTRGSTKLLANITTAVVAPKGHPVVLAVAPINGVSSVFVVTIDDALLVPDVTGNGNEDSGRSLR